MLFATRTTFNVPSLMGAIMSIGVATSNSILLITFANERRLEGDTAMQAAMAAGYTRLRPVLMTALALILGMLPMALGLGEGGEQNAPWDARLSAVPRWQRWQHCSSCPSCTRCCAISTLPLMQMKPKLICSLRTRPIWRNDVARKPLIR